MRIARAMRCGQVFVNGYGAGGGIELPFGGVKRSGHGREKGFEALYEFPPARRSSSTTARADMRLKGKTAIVTGAAQGFGYGIAETYVREGARVCVMDINAGKAREAARALGRRAFAVACDVAKSASVTRSFARAIERLGRLDIHVNNAGVSHRNQPLLGVTEEEFEPPLRRQRQVDLPDGTRGRPAFPAKRRRRHRQYRVHGGHPAAARPYLVQRHQGRGESSVQVDGC